MAALIDRALLQRIRLEVASWKAGGALSEVVMLGERPRKLTRHLLHLLEAGEVRGVRFTAGGRQVVLVSGLTPQGLEQMMEVAADEAERSRRLVTRARAALRRAGHTLLSSGWQRVSAAALSLLLGWLGLRE